MKTYKTSDVAKQIGLHPNTVRFYEEWGLIPPPQRKTNGYRVFNDFHIEQLRLARTALKIEIIQNEIRKKIIEAVKLSADKNFNTALETINDVLLRIQHEKARAEEAIEIVNLLLSNAVTTDDISLKRKEVSILLNIPIDTLRNWELNGLLTIKRKQNGYRVYTADDIRLLKIIHSLRCAGYSLQAILRMLSELSTNSNANIEHLLNSPKYDSEIISACDKLIISLQDAKTTAEEMIKRICDMKEKY